MVKRLHVSVVFSIYETFKVLTSNIFSDHFGIYLVDFESDERTRTIKKSGEFFKRTIATRCLRDDGCETESNDVVL